MKCIDLHPHALLGISKEACDNLVDASREDPFTTQYHLPEGTVILVESSAKRATEALARFTVENQMVFWKSVAKQLATPGAMGKVVDGNRYAATIVRLADSENGTLNFRMSP